MAQNQLFSQNIVGVPLRDDEVSPQQQLQIVTSSSAPPTFEHGYICFAQLNDQDYLRRVIQNQPLLASAVIEGPVCELKLEKTEQLAELIERRLSAANHEKKEQKNKGKRVKMKAVHIPIERLEIGQYKLKALHDAHLVAKYYYAKRKLVWEILEGGSKSKIEILWHDISNIRAVLPQGILEIMLQCRPSFFREVGPKPKKHTKWMPSEDFTGLEASTVRKHSLSFKIGVLDEHYSKLIQCDENLHSLSLQPFPDLELPFFTSGHNQRTTNPSYNNYHVTGFNFNQVSTSAQLPLLLPSTEQDQQFRTHNSTSSSLDISSETGVVKNYNQGLQDARPAVPHGGYTDLISSAGKQPIASSPSPQEVHQFKDLISWSSSSAASSLLSTSPALDTRMAAIDVINNNLRLRDSQQTLRRGRLFDEYADLSAKIYVFSANQQQPSSSTAAPMPSAQQVQQFRQPFPLPSSFLGINDSTLGMSTAGTEVINSNQMLQSSECGGLLDHFANFTTELSDPNDKELRDIEAYLHSEIDRQTLRQKEVDTNSSVPTFAAPPMQLQDPATHANIDNNTQNDDTYEVITLEDLFPGDDDANLQETKGEVYAQPTSPHFYTDAQNPH